MVFRTDPPREHARADRRDQSNGARRLTLLWFLTQDPRESWNAFFREEGRILQQSGHARLTLIAPFIPAKMGTDTYLDQLR